MKRRFDDAYSKVFNIKYGTKCGEYAHSYYECGITSDMSDDEKNRLVDLREAYLFELSQESELRAQGLI